MLLCTHPIQRKNLQAHEPVIMHLFKVLSLAAAAVITAVQAVSLPPGVPGNVLEFRAKHPYTTPSHGCRKTITIRASEDEHDDVSEEFKQGILDANNGGTLYLPKGEMFVIGKALDLTGLNDIYVRLDGEIRVSSALLWPIFLYLTSRNSSPMMSSIGKKTHGIIPSRSQSCFGNGAAKTSKFTAKVSSRAKGEALPFPPGGVVTDYTIVNAGGMSLRPELDRESLT